MSFDRLAYGKDEPPVPLPPRSSWPPGTNFFTGVAAWNAGVLVAFSDAVTWLHLPPLKAFEIAKELARTGQAVHEYERRKGGHILVPPEFNR